MNLKGELKCISQVETEFGFIRISICTNLARCEYNITNSLLIF